MSPFPLARTATFALAGWCALAGCRSKAGPDLSTQAAFVTDPPVVESLTLEVHDPESGKATVRLRFADDPRLPERLVVGGDREAVTLLAADPDPRLYAGTTRVDLDALGARQAHLDDLAEAHGPLVFPVFESRQHAKSIPVPRLDLPGLLAGKVVTLSPQWVTQQEVDAGASLLVTDGKVVGDPTRTIDPCTGTGAPFGKWSFAHLMQQLSGTNDPALVTERWLGQIKTATTVNGVTVPPRPVVGSAILDPWPRTPVGGLDLAKSPFRLLAIVNRIDLAENLSYGAGSGGELRFVFAGVKRGRTCTPLRFAVIFEYAVPRSGCASLRDWARAWVDLATHPLGSPAYNAALEALTEQIVRAGAGSGRPNGSLLAQLRTNEIAFLDLASNTGTAEWELREFRLDTAGFLTGQTVRRTPRPELNRTQTLADWVNANGSAELLDQYPPGTPFAGAHARMSSGTFWQGPTASSIAFERRHVFSLNTCSGCHARETDTAFTHVSPTAAVGSPLLSGFLTGITVADPVAPGVTRSFGDLLRRRTVLAGFANQNCLLHLFHVPLKMVH
jgi:hypothetical protein